MGLSVSERRGLNREEAATYLGVKPSFFDKTLRHRLRPKKMGTSLIFDRKELDLLFDQIMLGDGDVGPIEKGYKKWLKEPQEYMKQMMVDGGSTSATKESDFKAALKRIKQLKNG